MGVYGGYQQQNMGNTVTVTDDYIAQPADNTILVDTAINNKDILITIVGANTKPAGTQVRVKKISTDTKTMTVTAANGMIDGVASFQTNSSLKPSYTLETDTVNYQKV